jgi:hypothetical protein
MLAGVFAGIRVTAVESLASCSTDSSKAAVRDVRRLRRGRGSGELRRAGLWEGDGAPPGRVEDRGGVVLTAYDDGAVARARCRGATTVGAVRSDKRKALVDDRVGGKNIPSTVAN